MADGSHVTENLTEYLLRVSESGEPLTLSPQEMQEALHHPGFAAAMRESMWLSGDLSGLVRPHGQYRFYQFSKTFEPSPSPIILESHRRFGKSFIALVDLLEYLLQAPGRRAAYLGPFRQQLRSIVPYNLNRLLKTCPHYMRPKEKGERYIFQNPTWPKGSEPSILSYFGVNDNPDASRGAGTGRIVLDEVRDMQRLEYLMKSVLVYQLMDFQDDARVLMITTPPDSMDHPFIKEFVPQAMARGRHMVIRGSENKDFTRRDIDFLTSEGLVLPGSIDWEREVECRHVSDPEKLIVPEWVGHNGALIAEVERPGAFLPHIVLDGGWEDATHVLFGYPDFRNQRLVIEDEIWGTHITIGEIARRTRRRHQDLYSETSHFLKTAMISDVPPLTLNTLNADYHFNFEAAAAHDPGATLSKLRVGIGQKRVLIHPRCKHLIYQLDNGTWKEDREGKRTGFVRSPQLGHCDGIMALAYLFDKARWRRNPYPTVIHSDPDVFRRPEPAHDDESPLIEAFRR